MNRKQLRLFFVLFGTLAGGSLPRSGLCSAQDPLMATYAKMDEFAAQFKSLQANFKQVEHIDAIHEDNTDTGTIRVKRPKPKLMARFDFAGPNPKQVVTNGSNVYIYYPNNPDYIQEIELGKRKSLVDGFLALGFGGNSRELQGAYIVKFGGPEMVAGEKATRLELTPVSSAMLEQFKQIDLWISDKGGYAVQQKLYEKGHDYNVVTYSNVVQNPPLPDSIFKLDVPKGTKKEILVKK
jgi:outer membrane lipoprotein-sorting protein